MANGTPAAIAIAAMRVCSLLSDQRNRSKTFVISVSPIANAITRWSRSARPSDRLSSKWGMAAAMPSWAVARRPSKLIVIAALRS